MDTTKRILILAILWTAWPITAESAMENYAQRVTEPRLSGDVFDVDGLALQMGPALLRIESGRLYAARPVAGTSREFVFTGDARLEFEPPDDIERGQLEFFIGESHLNEPVESAVFVVANDRALEAITVRDSASVSAAGWSKAGELFREWVNSPERRVLAVDGAILRDVHGDPAYDDFFCAWMMNRIRGRFVYLVDPEAREQITLGRFEPLELTARERRKIRRVFHRQQRRGRLIGAGVDLLGSFDTWVSAPLADDRGVDRPGRPAFDAEHYDIELDVPSGGREVRGITKIRLRSQLPSSVVRLELHADLVVDAVEGPGGPLSHFASSGELLVFLPEVLEPGRTAGIDVSYHGYLIEQRGSSRTLLSTTGWYPNTGLDDKATFDVLLRWPERLDVVASGVVVDEGIEGDVEWQRRRLSRASSVFGFELGRFRSEIVDVRGIPVTFATDSEGRLFADEQTHAEMLRTVKDALAFFIDSFGDYPYEQLTLVTTGREFSQSLPGFITLSSLMITDDDWLAWVSGLKDPRGLIAHEIAHQWWGHVVSFDSYRDAWLSEGMANYAAKLYLRHRVPDLRFGWGPTAGWYREISQRLDNGTTIGEIGPVALGWRLNSSKASGYEPIVYRKGALVLGMLAQEVGSEAFLDALRILVDLVDQKGIALSSSKFLSLLGHIVQKDFNRFSEQFVFGTGLPLVDYEYEITKTEDNRWRMRGRVSRRADIGYRYHVVETGQRNLDVEREVVAEVESRDAALYLPLRIVLANDSTDGTRGNGAISYRSGRLILAKEELEIDYVLDEQPVRLELDPLEEVFALTSNLGAYPKRQQLQRGLRALAEGDLQSARAAFEAILESPAYRGEQELPRAWVSDHRDRMDARAHRELCRMELAAGRVESAARHLEMGAKSMSYSERRRINYRVLEARVALRRGDPRAAYEILERDIYRERGRHLEASLVFAIAAASTGHATKSRIVLARLRDAPVEFAKLERNLSG